MKTIWIKDNIFGAIQCIVIAETDKSYVLKKRYLGSNYEVLVRKNYDGIISEQEGIKRKNFFSKINKRINRIKKMKDNL